MNRAWTGPAVIIMAILILGTGATASSEAALTITGRVLPKNTITVNFIGKPLSGCAPLKVRFTDLSTSSRPAGKIAFWDWTFYHTGTMTEAGEITGTGGRQQNPTFTFRCPGVYDVSLRVCDRPDCSGSSNSLKKLAYICAASPDYLVKIDSLKYIVTSNRLDTLPRRRNFDPRDLIKNLNEARAELARTGCSTTRVIHPLTEFLIDVRYIRYHYQLSAGQKVAGKDLTSGVTKIIDAFSSCHLCPMPRGTCGGLAC
jgi:PKD repeat protein